MELTHSFRHLGRGHPCVQKGLEVAHTPARCVPLISSHRLGLSSPVMMGAAAAQRLVGTTLVAPGDQPGDPSETVVAGCGAKAAGRNDQAVSLLTVGDTPSESRVPKRARQASSSTRVASRAQPRRADSVPTIWSSR